MANAKEYKDLTEAASIDTDALVALAQPNAPELQTSKMSALAAKIQEINTDGPLAELELATSIGKQQLAEALTEKGAASTPSDTLVQMADKLRGLQTTDGLTFVKGMACIGNDNINLETAGYAAFCFCRTPNGHTIILSNNTLYIVETFKDYSSLSNILSSASASAPIHTNITTSAKVHMSLTKDGRTLTICSTDAVDSLDMYDINYENSTITYLQTVTGLTRSGSTGYIQCTVNNDRTMVAWRGGSSARYINVAQISDTSVIGTYSMSSDIDSGGFIVFDDSDTILVYCHNNSISFNNQGSVFVHKITYNVDESGSVSVSGSRIFSLANIYGVSTSDIYNNVVLILYSTKSLPNSSSYQYTKVATDLSFVLKDLTTGYEYSDTIASLAVQASTSPRDMLNMPVSVVGNVLTYYGVCGFKIVYDKQKQTVSLTMPIRQYYSTSPTMVERYTILAYSDTNIWGCFDCTYVHAGTNTYAKCYMVDHIVQKLNVLMGTKWSINGYTNYSMYALGYNDVSAGAYDVATTTVPLPEESQSQQEA